MKIIFFVVCFLAMGKVRLGNGFTINQTEFLHNNYFLSGLSNILIDASKNLDSLFVEVEQFGSSLFFKKVKTKSQLKMDNIVQENKKGVLNLPTFEDIVEISQNVSEHLLKNVGNFNLFGLPKIGELEPVKMLTNFTSSVLKDFEERNDKVQGNDSSSTTNNILIGQIEKLKTAWHGIGDYLELDKLINPNVDADHFTSFIKMAPSLLNYFIEESIPKFKNLVVGTKFSDKDLYTIFESLKNMHTKLKVVNVDNGSDGDSGLTSRIIERISEKNISLMGYILHLLTIADANEDKTVVLTSYHVNKLHQHLISPKDIMKVVNNQELSVNQKR